MIHIRTIEHEGVTFDIEYDSDAKKFSTLLPWKRVRIEGGWESHVTSEARKQIDARHARQKREKVRISFYGIAGGGKPERLTYRGVDLKEGNPVLDSEDGERRSGGRYGAGHLVLLDPTKADKLEMAYAVMVESRKAYWDLVEEHGTKVKIPYMSSHGDAEDRSARNLAAEIRLTKAIRETL